MERICRTEGCNNLGQYHRKNPKTGKVFRKPLCYGCRHRGSIKSKTRHNTAWRRFKAQKCKVCEYCGWEGPCDIHRPFPNKGYVIGNMKSVCPNCHRLLDIGALDDPYTI